MGGKSINDRFTDFCDRLTENLGNWYWPAAGLLLILVWAGMGPWAHYSDSWQLWVNTPTTVAEFFFDLFMLASNNRQVRNDQRLQKEIVELQLELKRITWKIKKEEDQILAEVQDDDD